MEVVTKNDLQAFGDKMRDERKIELDEFGKKLASDIKTEILEAIHVFAEAVDARFTKIETTMATKDYVDRKFWEMKSDMSAMMNAHVEAMH